jgi:hypothetical protein
MRASLQIGLTASDKVDDFGVPRDDNGLLAILVFDLRNTGRKGTASRELKPVSASRAQSFYAPRSIHLGSLPRLQVDQRAELSPLLPDRDQ